MGHGVTNSIRLGGQSEAEERALIKESVSTIAKGVGKAPRGWLSPGLGESVRTLDLLAENGIEYVGNWVNDEQPYPMRVKKGAMIAMPYSSELNDIPALISLHQSPERSAQMICDQFDVLYEDGAKTAGDVDLPAHSSPGTHRSGNISPRRWRTSPRGRRSGSPPAARSWTGIRRNI
jgi:peptidoglycan/xylan/chitin deacetylase (PgdA/CDA1 family)